MSQSAHQFSPKQVAQSLQVSESSVKRWCDQGIIPAVRTCGGHRRITLTGLRGFLRSTGRTLAAPEALGIDDEELANWDRMIAGKVGPTDEPDEPVTSKESLRDEFRAALTSGEEPRCLALMRQCLGKGWSRAEIAEDLIASTMRDVGDQWDCGKLAVYQERRSCTICVRLIHALQDSLEPVPPNAPIAIGAAPESDPYELPTALVELTLRECGWNAVNLGNNLPLDSLMQAVRDYQPRAVWLSVTAIDDAERFVQQQNELAALLDKDITLIVGGRALDDNLRPRLRYTAHCDSLRHLVELSSVLHP